MGNMTDKPPLKPQKKKRPLSPAAKAAMKRRVDPKALRVLKQLRKEGIMV
jgi:hypothetical protein